MRGGKQWAFKKFLRGYAVTIVTSALLLLILALLIGARYAELYSIRDISNINPLITSGQNELVAQKDENGVTRFVKEEDANSSSDKNTADTKNSSDAGGSGDTPSNSSSQSAGGGSAGTGSTGGTQGGGTTGGGNTGGNTGGGSQSAAFTASISSISHQGTTPLTLLANNCKITHYISVTLRGQNAPGEVTYRWKRSDNINTTVQTVQFKANETTKTVSADAWDTTGSSGSYSMTFEMYTPSGASKSVSFEHTCPAIIGVGPIGL